MKNTFYVLWLVGMTLALVTACKVPQATLTEKPFSLPGSYRTASDSANIADVTRQAFFRDTALVALIEAGIANNYDLLAAMQRIEAAQADILAARGALRPVVAGGINASLRKFGLYTMDGAGNITTEMTPGRIVPTNLPDYFPGFMASWEADSWGKLRQQKQAALSRYFATEEGKNLIVTQLVFEIAGFYYELQSLDQALEIIAETIRQQENALELVRLQKQVAAANELAVKQFEIDLLSLRGMEQETRLQIRLAENALNRLLARNAEPIPRTNLALDESLRPMLSLGLPAALLTNRPDIRAAEHTLAASKADVRAARAAFFPTVTLTGSLGLQAFRPDYLVQLPQSLAYGLFGGLMTPVFNRSAIEAAFATATAGQQEAYFTYQGAIANALYEVENELAQLQALDAVVGLKQQEVNILTDATSISGELFKSGMATYLEVLLTQQNTMLSRLELAEVRQRQFQAVAALYKALGGGWR